MKRLSRSSTWFALGALILACSCNSPKPLMKIARFTLTDEDVRYRNRVAKLFYPGEKNDVGLQQLERAYTYAAILEQNGHPVGDPRLDTEEARIDANTKDPAMLKKVKEIFGSNHEAYRRDFILPTYTERTIYFDFFLRNPAFHEAARQKAENFLKLVTDKPTSFEKIARDQNLSVSPLTCSPKNGMIWGKPFSTGTTSQLIDQSPSGEKKRALQEEIQHQADEAERREATRWIAEIGGTVPRGGIFQKIVDRQEYWLVVRYLGPKDGAKSEHRFVAAFFQKANYEEWLAAEKAKVKIERF